MIIEYDHFPFDEAKYYLKQWHLHKRLVHPEVDSRSSIECEMAWKLLGNFGCRDVVISVLDDGCNLKLPGFSSKNKFTNWAYIENNKLVTDKSIYSKPNNMFINGNYHGTSVCSLIASEPDINLPLGVAPNCSLFPIRWEKIGIKYHISEDIFLMILDFVCDKIDIMINTWSKVPIFEFSDYTINYINKLSKQGGRRGRGIVFVWAAGNSNCPINYESDTEIPYKGGLKKIGTEYNWYPISKAKIFRNNLCNLPNVVLIGSISSLAQRSHYSSYGPGLTCCAPSNNYHTYGLVDVKGLGLTTSYGHGESVTNNFKGTSGAAAIAGGVISLVISANLKLFAWEIVTIIKNSAKKDLSQRSYPISPIC